MSDDKSLLNKLKLVKFEDAVDFFSQRSGKACPACGHNKWTAMATFGAPNEQPSVSWSLSAMSLSDGETVNVGYPVAFATCKKCFFMRTHDLSLIANWVADGKPEFQDDE
ncbi:hypothetical protein [Massilia varians]|uniref:hypothetical protein n=1 Tax=Massilia varians TaxID=457921 RepID=UPI002553B250|nr:hypothetical protein [Massilia varians]MDK6078944.1 hypothetical protein [Massilia varians]